MNKEPPKLPEPSGKIEILTYEGNEVPTVKLFGQLETGDIAMCMMAIRVAYLEQLQAVGVDERSKQKDFIEAKVAKEEEEASEKAAAVAKVLGKDEIEATLEDKERSKEVIPVIGNEDKK